MTINLTEHIKYNRFTFKSKKLGIIYADYISTSNLRMIQKKLEKISSIKLTRYICTLICSIEEYKIKGRELLTKHESKLLKKKELRKFSKKLINHNLFLSKQRNLSLKKTYHKNETQLLKLLLKKDKKTNDQSTKNLFNYAKYGNRLPSDIMKNRQLSIREYMDSILPSSSIFNEMDKIRKSALTASDYRQRMLEDSSKYVFNNNHISRIIEDIASPSKNLKKIFEESVSSISQARKMINDSVKNVNSSLDFNTLADALVTNHSSLYLNAIGDNSLTANLTKIANAEITGSKYLNSILDSIKLPDITEILKNTNITNSRVENYSEDELVEIKSTVNEYLAKQIPVEKWNPLTLKNFEKIVIGLIIGVVLLVLSNMWIKEEKVQINNYNYNFYPIVNKYESLENFINKPPKKLDIEYLDNCRLVDVEITSYARLRSESNYESSNLATLNRGTLLEVLDDTEENGWIYVLAHLNGNETKEGWIDKSLTISFSTIQGDCDE